MENCLIFALIRERLCFFLLITSDAFEFITSILVGGVRPNIVDLILKFNKNVVCSLVYVKQRKKNRNARFGIEHFYINNHIFDVNSKRTHNN